MPCFPVLWRIYQHVVFQPVDHPPPWLSFAIITASNPASRKCTHVVNRCANAALAKHLRRRTQVRLLVCSPHFRYHECSFAAPLPLRTAVRLAAQFRQIAIYYVHLGCLYLVPVSARHLPYRTIALGAYSAQAAMQHNRLEESL